MGYIVSPSYLAHPAPHDPLLAEPRHIEQCAHIRNTNRRLSCALVAGIDEGVRPEAARGICH